MLTKKDLVSKGYFPAELTPNFNTTRLGDCLDVITDRDLEGHLEQNRTSKCCIYTIPKMNRLRRILGIPNPLHQIALCNAICDNWDSLKSHFDGSLISISRPEVKAESKRAISMEYEFRQKEIQNLFRSIGSRYHLKIDISRYYSTIYTHIIPWALHTKIVAKRRQRDNSLYGNTIDKCIRNMQDAQTLGITIGPDTSAIIAEVIGTALDVEIQRVYTNDIKGFRQIDDFSLFFNDLSEAEKALSNVQSILKNYELEINVQKTKILPLPEQFIPEWKVDIRSFSFRDGNSVKKQNTDLLDYFSKTFKYCTLFPGDSVLKYALKRIRGETIHPDNWSIYESLILKSITSDPNCLETATEILKQYNDLGYDLNKERISECINEMLLFHSRFRDDHELSWTLYLAKSLGIRINGTLIKGLSFLENPIVILGLLDLRESSLLEDSLDTALWERFIRREECLRRTGS